MRLESWIREKHLDPAEQARVAERYASDAFKSIWIDDFLRPAMLADLRRLFAEEGRFRRKLSVFDPSVRFGRRDATLEEYLAAPEEQRFESGVVLEGPRSPNSLEPGVATFVAFRWLLASPAFRGFLGALVGYDPGVLLGAQARIIGRGETMGRHNDATRNRALCMVMYLSPDWTAADRGFLRQFAPGERMREVEPRPNRAVFFTVKKGFSHAVEAQAGDRVPRWSHTAWFGRAPGLHDPTRTEGA
jgi:hypothetical protein